MRVFSGIQPSGGLHLGNYLGAVRQWLSPPLQGAPCALFSVVDLHALSSPARATPALRRHTLEMSAALLACGLTPSPRLHLFPQSAVREHTELAWLLSCQTPLGKLQRISVVEFRDDLPRSTIGKVMKKDLRAPYWATEPVQA